MCLKGSQSLICTSSNANLPPGSSRLLFPLLVNSLPVRPFIAPLLQCLPSCPRTVQSTFAASPCPCRWWWRTPAAAASTAPSPRTTTSIPTPSSSSPASSATASGTSRGRARSSSGRRWRGTKRRERPCGSASGVESYVLFCFIWIFILFVELKRIS